MPLVAGSTTSDSSAALPLCANGRVLGARIALRHKRLQFGDFSLEHKLARHRAITVGPNGIARVAENAHRESGDSQTKSNVDVHHFSL